MSLFGLSACDIRNGQPIRAQMGDFGGICKVLTISRLNFTNTKPESKTGLKKPKRACKRAAVAMQLRPFCLSGVALSHIRRTE
ncbi:hypothetical protein HMPREF1146_1881 [Prevotella sp. MSX73]|nr:hypothetical protein HMPREF1146_1881 [Prevotella sp. MSX73]